MTSQEDSISISMEMPDLAEKGRYTFVVFFILTLLISIQYQFGTFGNVDIPVYIVSAVGWATLLLVFPLLSRGFFKELLVVFFLFFLVGFAFGPFLEPPSDPLEHLRRIYAACDASTANWFPRQVQGDVSSSIGLWHYSMSSSILCDNFFYDSPELKLTKIHLLHGILLGVLISAIYVMGKRAGLISRWAFFGCLTAFLFMGTNSFSYFRYYSFSPGYTSMLFCWLWVAGFFFKNRLRDTLLGGVVTLAGSVILWTNHFQEAVFLFLIFFSYLLANMYPWLERLSNYLAGLPKLYGGDLVKIRRLLRCGLTLFFVIVFFVLPQIEMFRAFISEFFIKNLWSENQELVLSYKDYYFLGKFWEFRAEKTFTSIAVVIVIFGIIYYNSRIIKYPEEYKNRIVILSLLPLFVYLVPLACFMWVSHVQVSEFYRVCYVSMYWLFFASFFQGVENYIHKRKKTAAYAA